mmetsp:Transcript_24043/g.60524  ORF Transcript_24043/g.60524 Transcript_24043/m.60524 type:complete len:97 (-) Transcript_24043:632-922(-)|eukprot:jgi/Tetstr1/443084/TSEL_031140.t1
MSAQGDSSEQQARSGPQRAAAGSTRKTAPPAVAPAAEVWAFKCAAEASALLNCVANGGKKVGYNELKCLNSLKALRACCEKEGVVDFTLTSDSPSP